MMFDIIDTDFITNASGTQLHKNAYSMILSLKYS